MTTLQPDRRDEVVQQAVQAQTPVVLTVHQRDGWATLKSSFVASTEGERAILVALPAGEKDRESARLQPGERVGVSFRRGHKKCVFATAVQATDTDPPHGASAATTAVLRWPETVQELQRRVYHRARIPAGRTVRVDIWPGHTTGPGPSQPEDPPKLSGTIEDLSVGGLRAAIKENAEFAPGSPVLCVFAVRANAEPFLLNAVFRHVEPHEHQLSYGFQFVGLEVRPDGPHILSRLAGVVVDLQRAAVRQSAPRRSAPRR